MLILPYLGERELFERYDFSQPWNSEANLRLANEMPSAYSFHGEYRRETTTTTNYLAVVGDNTVWPGGSPRTADEVLDEHSSTILLVENIGANVHWMEPRDLDVDTMSFQINDPIGISSKYRAPAVVMLDDLLRRLEVELSEVVLRAFLSINGREQLASTGDSWHLLLDGRLRGEQEINPETQH